MRLECEFCLTARRVKPGSVFKTCNPEADLQSLMEKLNISKMPYYAVGKDLVFYSASLGRLKELNSHPARSIHELVGWFCGYPECCIEAFLKVGALKPMLKGYRKKCLRLEVEDPYRIVGVNPVNIEAGSLISHIPCSPLCEETQRLVELYEKNCLKEGCPLW